LNIEQGEKVAITQEPMATSDLNEIIHTLHPGGKITRQSAKLETPLTNGEARDVNGVDEVDVNLNNIDTKHFQCVFCGETYRTPTSVRSHLVKHGDKQTTMKDAKQIAEAILNGKSIYAPYDTDEENILFMKRTIETNGAALSAVLRKAKSGGNRMVGRTPVDTEELKTLRAKAKAYDALKAQTLKSQFPV